MVRLLPGNPRESFSEYLTSSRKILTNNTLYGRILGLLHTLPLSFYAKTVCSPQTIIRCCTNVIMLVAFSCGQS